MIEIPPFRTMELLVVIEARRRAGAPVFRFDVGEPQHPASARVRERAAAAIREQQQSYTESRGRLELRNAIARWYETEYGARVDPQRIVVTAGASAALTLAVLAGFPQGARIAMPRPGYPAYRNITLGLGRIPLELDCGAATDFKLNAAQLAALDPRPDGVLFASPANPTGSVLTKAELDDLLACAGDIGARVISDEIYQSMAFDMAPITAAEDERAFVVNSFSKFWRMTGWRIGWLVCPPDLVARVDAIAQHFYLCPSGPGQIAALAALDEADDCRAALSAYKRNCGKIVAALRGLGIATIAPSQGAFYVYADFSAYTDDSMSFAKRVLEETGIALAPGVDFDPIDGHKWIRFAGTATDASVDEGLARLTQWLRAKAR